MKKISAILVVILLVVLFFTVGVKYLDGNNFWICENGEWIKYGSPITKKPKIECKKEAVDENYKYKDIIVLTEPKIKAKISSPLFIKGKVRGTWFFEGDFPIVLTNWDGLIIAEAYVTAKGELMTEDFVAFEAILKFEKPELYNTGSLILKKDNPSGFPENDDAFEIPIVFK